MWLVLRTDYAKERVVAAAVERMDWPCWVPLEVRHGRARDILSKRYKQPGDAA